MSKKSFTRHPGGTAAARVALVRDVMSTRIEKIHLDVALTDAARKMREADAGVLPVYDGTELLGMLSDRDIVIRVVAEGRNPAETSVEDAYSPGVYTCSEDEPLVDAITRMARHAVRRLVVVDADDQPSGILSLADAALADAAESHVAAALAQSDS